jgi:hypothetical protein
VVQDSVSCLRDRGGCSKRASLPMCPAGLRTTWPTNEMKRPSLDLGAFVVVEGTVRSHALCTALACRDECCNTCSGSIELHASGNVITLAARGRELRCSGDESMMCCDFEANGQRIIVRGTVSEANPWRQTATITDPQVCQVADGSSPREP